ncbi:hypothetical protein [Paenibacillus sp.]|uniref:hypothetical protein n=1 Tax=Paenibacillus sp. TaxID=58172 RepID=UPI002D699728|nr:hypothetical protein [Paenibacillus sp.]HZG56148.1 hypothetical protein [Paenibacillus sp.]
MRGNKRLFLMLFVACSAAGYGFAGYFGHFPGGYTGEEWRPGAAVVGFVFGAVTGAVAGLLQWAALRGFGRPGGGRLVLAVAGAFAITHAFLDVRSTDLESLFLGVGLAGGALLGLLHALAYGRGARRALRWVVGGGLSWGVGLWVSDRLLHGPASEFMMNHTYDGLAVGLLNGAVFAFLHVQEPTKIAEAG